MLPSRQLEKVKGELLKLAKKETMAQRSLDRRAEEQNNSRLSLMAQRGQKREERKKLKNNEIEDCQTWHNTARIEKPKKQKNKEIADCQTWHNVARRGEPKKTEEQRNGRLVRQDVSRDLKESHIIVNAMN
ncbi:hypothetical protein AVEN_93195-1 [Araneus ventricosus]|uniref:Uncharacterized protein n=1 Tax=Araneus ventricosus TaxID=182803 RepID=A0A4Y2TH66_ARAVE|nr:hypothetical protein AVEN_93195-1 [Araneus ventricosus]